MQVKKVGFFILILTVASCSSPVDLTPPPTELSESVDLTPTLTQEIERTNTVTPFPPTITPTHTHTPIPTEPQISISKTSAIIARLEGGINSFSLVGGSQNGSWVSAADVVGSEDFGSKYHLYSAFTSHDMVTGNEPVSEPICGQYYVNLESFSISQSAVGISGDWSVLPRTPQELSTEIEIYLQTVAAWQVDQAPSQPIAAINKIWKVDVEGNGTDEVFINATRFAEPTGHNVEPRDYSVILMRTVIGSDVVTVELVGDYYSEVEENRFPLTYTLEFIGDLNGDGQMEVVVGVSRWEGTGLMVFEIDGKDVQLVLSVMCSL